VSQDKRSSHSIATDRWDRAYYEKIRREMAQVGQATDDLMRITPTAQPEMFDAFQMFMKSRPEMLGADEMRDDHRINHAVNVEAMDLPEMSNLRRFTRGDLVGAAMAAVKIEPDLEVLFDRQKFRQRQAEELQRLRDELMEKLQQLMQNPPPPQPGGQGDGEGEDDGESGGEPSLQDQIDALRRAIEAAENALEQGLSADQTMTAAQLQAALKGATEEARANWENARAYGIEPGRLTRLNAAERLKLAAKLNTNHLRRIAQLFGPVRNLAFASRQRIIPDMPHEMTGVRLSDDLSRLTPSELLKLVEPDLEDQFFEAYAEKRLMTHRMRGREKIGRGGIICCIDSSGSMSGEREMMAKAIMLVLLNIAKVENRSFHVIHFGSPGQFIHQSFARPEDFTVDKIVNAAETFMNSGTCVMTPVDEAIKLLQAEHRATGFVQSDIVFLSDGCAAVTDEWQEKFYEDLDAIEGHLWGVLIGNDMYDSPDILNRLSRGNLCHFDDLTTAGTRDIGKIFRGIQKETP
jgi:uncharacterized protein with von Willebrand factor type A (vWA) domain